MADINQNHLLQDIQFYLSGVILLAVCILGLIANGLVAAVLTHKSSLRSSTNVFLLALALFDSLVLLCTPFLICFQPLSSRYSEIVHPNVMPYLYPLALTAQTCTIWITVSFTVERYIAVTHPLKAGILCTVKRARIITITVTCLSVLYNFSRWFEYKSTPVQSKETNETVSYRIESTKLVLNSKYDAIYFTGLYLVVMCFIPVALLSVLNYFLIQAVQQSRKELAVTSPTSTHKENNITIMLVSVVAVFIVCQAPALVYNVAYGIAKEKIKTSLSWEILSIIRNFLVILNSAINFILYCAFGQNFRKVFLRLFCQRKPKVNETRASSDRRTLTTNGSVMLPMLERNCNSKVFESEREMMMNL